MRAGRAVTHADRRPWLERVIPAGRLCEPDEVAGLADCLASGEAACITGATYVIDGGMIHFNRGL